MNNTTYPTEYEDTSTPTILPQMRKRRGGKEYKEVYTKALYTTYTSTSYWLCIYDTQLIQLNYFTLDNKPLNYASKDACRSISIRCWPNTIL